MKVRGTPADFHRLTGASLVIDGGKTAHAG
jgi:hypothetical protein